MSLLVVLVLIVVAGRFDAGLPGQKESWWRHRRPLPSDPYVMEPRYVDQVDVRYMLDVGVVRPLWRALTKPWRHPSCRWPVKCDQLPIEE